MIDKKPQITKFIEENFEPGTLEAKDPEYTTNTFLQNLFSIFPTDCIDADDLFDILICLGYTPFKKDAATFCWCIKEKG